MRKAFSQQLSVLGDELGQMSVLTCAAMRLATRSLVEADLALAEQVIAGDDEIGARRRRCEALAHRMLVQQAPIARSLRVVVTGIQAAEKIERMGDLARHLAELVRMRHPHPVVPAELVSRVELMGRLAADAGRGIGRALAEPTGTWMSELDHADDAIDTLQDALLDQVRQPHPAYSVQVGVDVALMARYFERFADQAVGVAKLLDYSVTGEMRSAERPIELAPFSG